MIEAHSLCQLNRIFLDLACDDGENEALFGVIETIGSASDIIEICYH